MLNDLERDDYLGHMVAIFDKNKHGFWLQDPGLVPRSNRRISRQKLADAMFSAGREKAVIVALRLNEDS